MYDTKHFNKFANTYMVNGESFCRDFSRFTDEELIDYLRVMVDNLKSDTPDNRHFFDRLQQAMYVMTIRNEYRDTMVDLLD